MRTLPTTNYERRTTNPSPSPVPECYVRLVAVAKRNQSLVVLAVLFAFAVALVPVSKAITRAMIRAEIAQEQAR